MLVEVVMENIFNEWSHKHMFHILVVSIGLHKISTCQVSLLQESKAQQENTDSTAQMQNVKSKQFSTAADTGTCSLHMNTIMKWPPVEMKTNTLSVSLSLSLNTYSTHTPALICRIKMDGNKSLEPDQRGCILISILPMGKLWPPTWLHACALWVYMCI